MVVDFEALNAAAPVGVEGICQAKDAGQAQNILPLAWRQPGQRFLIAGEEEPDRTAVLVDLELA